MNSSPVLLNGSILKPYFKAAVEAHFPGLDRPSADSFEFHPLRRASVRLRNLRFFRLLTLESKWVQEHERNIKAFVTLEPLESDKHPVLSGCWGLEIGSEKAVPPGEDISEIPRLFLDFLGMVNAMHVRSDEHPTEQSFQPSWQGRIGVREEAFRTTEEFHGQDCGWRRSQNRHGGKVHSLRQGHLDRMSPRSR